MKALLALLLAASAAHASAPPYFGQTINTAAGTATQYLSGSMCVAASSASAGTCTINVNGANGNVTATSFTGNGAGLTNVVAIGIPNTLTSSMTFTAPVLLGGSSITLTGSNGYITSSSSVTASAFFGNGANLTGIPSTGSISGAYLPLAGGTMSGALTVNSNVTAYGIALTYGISGATAAFTNTVSGQSFYGNIGNGYVFTGGIYPPADFISQTNAPSFSFPGSSSIQLQGQNTATGSAFGGNIYAIAGTNTANSAKDGKVELLDAFGNLDLVVSDSMTTVGALLGLNVANQETVGSTLTVQGNAFSVGGSTLVVSGGVAAFGDVSPSTMSVLELGSPNNAVANGGLILSRYHNGNDNWRASGLFDYYTSQDMLVFTVAGAGGVGGSQISPMNLSQAKMVVQESGKVGIGTTSPATTLEVNGTAQVDGNSFSVGGSTLVVSGGNTGVGGTSGTLRRLMVIPPTAPSGAAVDNEFAITDNNYYTMDFVANQSSTAWRSNLPFGLTANNAANPQIFINGSGNVGIGTTSPSATLDVTGTASGSGVGIPVMTTAQVQASTPLRVGVLIFNSTKGAVCVSTGTTIQAYEVVGNTLLSTCQ